MKNQDHQFQYLLQCQQISCWLSVLIAQRCSSQERMPLGKNCKLMSRFSFTRTQCQEKDAGQFRRRDSEASRQRQHRFLDYKLWESIIFITQGQSQFFLTLIFYSIMCCCQGDREIISWTSVQNSSIFFKGVDIVRDFRNFESIIDEALLFYPPIFRLIIQFIMSIHYYNYASEIAKLINPNKIRNYNKIFCKRSQKFDSQIIWSWGINRRENRAQEYINKNIHIIMRAVYADRHRQSASVMHANRRYMKKGVSPDMNSFISPSVKSNQDLVSQLGPHLQSQNNRKGERSQNNFTSTSKLANRQQLIINYELFGLSHSKNFMGDRRKGKSSYYKKIGDLNSSEMLFTQLKSNTTKEMNKMKSQQESISIEAIENQPEEMHYRMVDFQQKCKKMVKN